MFESLDAIANSEAKEMAEKERKDVGKGEKDDKESLNLYILIMGEMTRGQGETRTFLSKALFSTSNFQLTPCLLFLENMHHFYMTARSCKVKVLEQPIKVSKASYDLNLDAYVKVVIRRPLGKLLEFFDGVEEQMKKGSAEEVSFHLNYSKAAFKDIVKRYPTKEVNFFFDSYSLANILWFLQREILIDSLTNWLIDLH